MEKIKMLVIDDNIEFCFRTREHAKSFPDVEFCGAAHDGLSALELIKKTNPDVILLDDILPRLDGLGVMKRLQTFADEARPKVVAVTASPTESYVSAMFGMGADYITSKSTEIPDLISRCILTVQNGSENLGLYPHDAERLITSAVCAVGVPANMRGYCFLRTSIDLAIKNPDIIHSITTQLYPEVAKRHNTTSIRIERNIRHAIEVAWTKGDKQAFEKIFGIRLNFISQRPTNSEFIAMLADKIRLALK